MHRPWAPRLLPFLQDLVYQFAVCRLAEMFHNGPHGLHFIFILRKINILCNPGRDFFPVALETPEIEVTRIYPALRMVDLTKALADVMARAALHSHHHVAFEPLSVRERMSIILDRVRDDRFTDFEALFTPEEGRQGVVVTLIAILELVKSALIELVQLEPFAKISVKAPEPIEA